MMNFCRLFGQGKRFHMANSDINKIREKILKEISFEYPEYNFLVEFDPPDYLINDYYQIFSGSHNFPYHAVVSSHISIIKYYWPSVLHVDFVNTDKTNKLMNLFTRKTPWIITHQMFNYNMSVKWRIQYNKCTLKELNIKSEYTQPKQPGIIQTIFDINGGYDIINN